MIPAPEDVLEQLERDIDAMQRRGQRPIAKIMQQIATDFRAALAPLRLVSEHDAMVRDGKSARWHRERFDDWAKVHSAREQGGERFYRLNVLPVTVSAENASAVADAMMRSTG